MEVFIERRPPYQLTANTTIDAKAAAMFRGPLLYALAPAFNRTSAPPWEEAAGLLPRGQPHGQTHSLVATADWAFALRIDDDAQPVARFVPRAIPEPPLGQGPFAAALVPATLVVQAQLVGDRWNRTSGPSGGAQCGDAELPPTSPVLGITSPLQHLVLIPYGATDLRIAEFPTTVAS